MWEHVLTIIDVVSYFYSRCACVICLFYNIIEIQVICWFKVQRLESRIGLGNLPRNALFVHSTDIFGIRFAEGPHTSLDSPLCEAFPSFIMTNWGDSFIMSWSCNDTPFENVLISILLCLQVDSWLFNSYTLKLGRVPLTKGRETVFWSSKE